MPSNATIDLLPDKWHEGLAEAKTRLTLVEGGKSITDSEPTATADDAAKVPITTATTTALPSLDGLPTISINEILRQTDREIAEKKEWLKRAGAKLLDYEDALGQLDTEAAKRSEDITLASDFQSQRAAVQDGIERITAVDPEMMDRLQFAKFIELVKRCDHMNFEAVKELLASVVAANRYHIASQGEVARLQGTSKGLPKHTIFFFGKTYFPAVFEAPAPGQRALEIELVKLVMKARGGNRPTTDLLASKEGFYYLYSPKGQRDTYEGHALVKLYNDADTGHARINILDAMGNVAAMADHRQGRTSVPLRWVTEGKVLSRARLDQAEFDRSLYLIKKLRFILGLRRPESVGN